MTDDAHFTHGLAGDQQVPDWPPLAADEVSSVLAGYPALGATGNILWHSPRPLSAAARVATAGGEVFVKRHHRRVRDVPSLSEEHRFAAHVRERGMPVPAVLADASGRSAVERGDWVYEVHRCAVGTDVYREAFSWSPIGGIAHARVAGAMLARLHLAAEGFDAPQRGTHLLVARADILGAKDALGTLADQLPVRPALAAYLHERDWRSEIAAAVQPWQARAAAGVARQAPLWTHGDWHVSNLCWSAAGDAARITDVLDFGLCACTFALFDLATAIERNAIAWLELGQGPIARTDLALALVDGYRSVRPLTDDDLGVLTDVLPVVHVDFALSEVEYFEGVTRRRDHADVAYRTFLLGHAYWFASAEGQALLHTLRHAGRAFVVQ
ncbi:phosphotransferase enzyme family protein [Xanthomonas sp. NCPPB 2632]|uniref:phosphotransferase enzyme family protein n=1 Tax=Xanthomonas sp. NCPPB 2632 TaxID=3240912 RepID=UPI0035148F0C